MKCNECGLDRPDEEFNWRKFGVKRNTRCKECTRKWQREHYAKNADRRKNEVKLHNRRYRKRNRTFFYRWLAQQRCVVCGEDNPLVLDLHHRNSDEKEHSVTTMVHGAGSLEKIMFEIEKCVILCANCHRLEHFVIDSKGWRRRKVAP